MKNTEQNKKKSKFIEGSFVRAENNIPTREKKSKSHKTFSYITDVSKKEGKVEQGGGGERRER